MGKPDKKDKLSSADKNVEFAENIINTVREPLLVLDKDLRVLKASRSFFNFFKVNSEETIGRLIYDLGNQQWDIPKLRELLETILPEKTYFDDFEVEHDFISIGKRFMLLNARQIKRVYGKEKIILLAFEDITERKLSEISLNESNRMTHEYLDILFNRAHVPIIIWNSSSIITHINNAFEKLCGYSWEEIKNKNINFLFRKDNIVSILELIKNTIYSDKEDIIEIDILTKSKEVKTILWNSTNIFDKEGEKVVATIAQDITNRKRAEDALSLLETRYRRLFESAKDGILILDALTCKIIDVNPFLIDLLSYTKDKFIDKELWEIGFFNDIAANKEKFLELQKKEYVRYDSLPLETMDGRKINVEFVSNVYLVNERKVIQCNIRDITERKKIEKLLQESEERYRSFFDNSMDGILLTSPDGRTLSANQAACKMFGYTKDELINLGRSGIVDTADPKLSSMLAERAEKGKVQCELTFIRKDGTRFPCEISSSIFKDHEGNERTSMVVRDISEHKRILQKIKESEKRFRAIFDQAPFAIALLDNQGHIIISNSKLSKMIGYSFNELSGMKFTDFTHPEDIDKDMKIFTDLINGKIYSYTLEKRYIHKNGTIVLVNISVSLLRRDSDTFMEILGMAEDITERKNSENELIESEEKFRIITENSADAIFIVDNQGRYKYINAKAVQMLGFSKEEMMQYTIADISPKNKVENYFHIFKQILNDGFAFAEIDLVKKDGNLIPVDFNAVLLPNGLIYASCRNITERIEIQNKIKFQSDLLFNVGQAVIATDLSGSVIYWNHGAEKIYGWSSDEAIGKNIIDLIPAEHTKKQASEIMNQLSEGNSWSGEFIVKRKDGTAFTAYVTDSPINDANGKLIGVIGISSDITERKLTEEWLQKLSQVVEQSPVSIIITDTNGNMEYANQKLIESTGYQLSEIVGKNPRMFSSGEKLKVEYKELWNTILSKKEWRGEFLNKKKNGELYWELALISPIINKNGNVTHYLAIKEDITEQKRAEDKLLILAHALKSINECVSITDSNDNIIFINQSFLKTYGYEEDELIGKNMSLVRSIKNSPRLTEDILPATLDGGWQGELWNKRKDGSEFQIYLSTTSIYDKENKLIGLIGVAKDVTELKLNQHELIKAKENAEQSDKLKSEFLAQMSHEIRTPLNAILGNVEYLNDFYNNNTNQETTDSFESIEIASKRITRTVDLILNAAELRTSGYKPLFVNIDLDSGILNKLCKEHQLSAKQKGLELTYICKTDETKITADEYSVTQIFANLIDNAIKYTIEGKIEIILTKNKTDNIVVEIKDSGIGISEEFIPRLFDPFAQEEQGYSRSFEGNGLGLALVKSYCELNNIKLEVESTKNVGSTFRIVF